VNRKFTVKSNVESKRVPPVIFPLTEIEIRSKIIRFR